MAGLYYRKSGNGNKYDFDLNELIDNFSFYEFCSNVKSLEHGVFLAITNKQYIIGYNAGFGDASHDISFAKVMKELNGGGKLYTEKDAISNSIAFEKKYIGVRICFEIIEDFCSHGKEKNGYMYFDFASKKIPQSQYEMFMSFYNDYHEEVELVCKKFNFDVYLHIRDDNGKLKEVVSKDLEKFREYFTNNIIDDDFIDDEVIINKAFSSKSK